MSAEAVPIALPAETGTSSAKQPVAMETDAATEAEPANSFDLDRLSDAVSAALEAAGHNTAAVLLANGKWTQTGEAVQVEVSVKKTMLNLTMNSEAERIVKSAAREAGFLRAITIVSAANGTAENGAGSTPAKRPPSGSLQAEALAHPLVKQALELFNGEVRSVLDLREKRNS